MSCELLYIKTLIRTVGCHFVHTYLAPYVRLPKPWTLKPMFSYLRSSHVAIIVHIYSRMCNTRTRHVRVCKCCRRVNYIVTNAQRYNIFSSIII